MTAVPPSFRCRASGSSSVVPVLDLGTTPLANALPTPEAIAGGAAEPAYPLLLVFCPDSALVQITETVPPDVLFGEYLYFSSFSDTVLENARGIAGRMLAERSLGPSSLVVEIASNDGYLLRNYVERGIGVLGIEPAANIAAVAEERGIPTRNDFFSADLARELRAGGLAADVVHANNVLAHVADLTGVVDGLRILLKDTGVAVIEVPYVKDMIDHCEFDTIYHEHLCYFSLTALDRLFRSRDMVVEDVERIPIHGGSLRVFAAPAVPGREPSQAVRQLLQEEAGWGVASADFYRGFARRVEGIRDSLRALLQDLKADGRRIAAYGAAAKGSTLLNYCGIGSDLLEYVVDRSTYKQGRCMPGVHLPIHPPERLLQDRPDYLLVLAWNFLPEIMAQQEEYRRGGGAFVVPVPEPRIVTSDRPAVPLP
jgi:SAM-dependent methyltransferase